MWKEVLDQYVMPTLLPILITAASILLTMGIAYLRNWSKRLMEKWKMSDAEKATVDAIFQGIVFAQEHLVVELKRGAEDGKLTKEERAQALDLALDHAKKIATGPAKDLLMVWSREKVDGVVKSILAKISKK